VFSRWPVTPQQHLLCKSGLLEYAESPPMVACDVCMPLSQWLIEGVKVTGTLFDAPPWRRTSSGSRNKLLEY